MNQDKLIELAKQAGFKPDCATVRLAFYGFDIKQFAELVRAETLEEAAKKCEQYAIEVGASSDASLYAHQYANAGAHCAEAIRSLK